MEDVRGSKELKLRGGEEATLCVGAVLRPTQLGSDLQAETWIRREVGTQGEAACSFRDTLIFRKPFVN